MAEARLASCSIACMRSLCSSEAQPTSPWSSVWLTVLRKPASCKMRPRSPSRKSSSTGRRPAFSRAMAVSARCSTSSAALICTVMASPSRSSPVAWLKATSGDAIPSAADAAARLMRGRFCGRVIELESGSARPSCRLPRSSGLVSNTPFTRVMAQVASLLDHSQSSRPEKSCKDTAQPRAASDQTQRPRRAKQRRLASFFLLLELRQRPPKIRGEITSS
mmetsp:Transcript_25181/g.54782  ORF Transcript_25181/g.54782 Transcript_25181/m.54782 type:complete len:220 (-) Transcript_25181:377-1036(-)